MKRLFAILYVLTVLCICYEAGARAKKEYDAYLLIGQSNMARYGEMLQKDVVRPKETKFIFHAKDV